MKKKSLLALGIPTYGRPEFAIRAIKKAVAIKIYDQIIISSNSYEKQIYDTIRSLGVEEITYYQQDSNVGMSLNYYEVIKLCKCKYLHIVSDEDSINKQNTSELYSLLRMQSKDFSVIFLSIKALVAGSSYGLGLYRDASGRKNKSLKNVFGDAGHIGSSIINVGQWTSKTFKKMDDYCRREGNAYPTTAAAILSYSTRETLFYFAPHIVEMLQQAPHSEMGGSLVYGFKARLNQFISLIILLECVSFKGKTSVYLYLCNFFFHYCFIDAIRKFPDDSPILITREVLKGSVLSFKVKFMVSISLIFFYYFVIFYALRKPIGNFLRLIKLRT